MEATSIRPAKNQKNSERFIPSKPVMIATSLDPRATQSSQKPMMVDFMRAGAWV